SRQPRSGASVVCSVAWNAAGTLLPSVTRRTMPSRNDGSWRTIRSRRFCIRDTSQKTASVAPATSAAQAASSPPRRPAHSVATAVVAASAASGARISDTPARFDTFSHASAARSRQRASPSAGFSARAPGSSRLSM
ncbi:hypothetical protein BMAFMH_C0824, partial [Burkholderia mallei FMH]